MRVQRLRKKLEKSNDKLSIFANKKLLRKYSFTDSELCDIIKDFLTDDQIEKLFEYEHFRKLMQFQIVSIIKLIKDEKIKLNLLEDDELLTGISQHLIMDITETLQENGKVQLLHNKEFIEKHEISSYYIKKIILSLSESKKIELLLDKEFLKNELKLDEDWEISEIVASLEDEDSKTDMIDIYNFRISTIEEHIFITYSDEYKTKMLIENKYNFKKFNIIQIICNMNIDFLINFFNENSKFLKEKEIAPYEVIKKLDNEKQLEFISKFEELKLTVRRKKTNISNLKTRGKR